MSDQPLKTHDGRERPLADICDAFARARGLKTDAAWARRAAWALLDGHHVRVDGARRALGEALAQLRNLPVNDKHADGDGASGTGRMTPVGDILGEPDDWAAEHAAEWREDGIDVFEDGPVPSLGLRDVVVYGCGFGSAVTLLF